MVEQEFALLSKQLTRQMPPNHPFSADRPRAARGLAQQGVDVIGSTLDELGTFIKPETIRWAKAVKDSGATAD